jgi:hypothetical protein
MKCRRDYRALSTLKKENPVAPNNKGAYSVVGAGYRGWRETWLMSATMAEKRTPKAVEQPTEPTEKKGPNTTFRLHKEDGEILAKLAKEMGLTIAETYRRRYAADAKAELIKLTEAKLRQWKEKG